MSMSERIDYYPVRVPPGEPVWEVDHRIRTHAGLPSIHPPTDMKSRRGPRGLRIDKPVAIIHCTCYFGFRRGAVAEDFQRMKSVAVYFYGKLRDGRCPLQVLGMDRGKPYALSADDIVTLRKLDVEGSQKALTAVHKSIKPGEAVRVSVAYKDGALVDLMGPDPVGKGPPVLIGFDGDEAQIHAWMIGAARVMTVPAWAVERA